MPILMEKKDWVQTVANVGTASRVWYENVTGDAGTSSVVLPESGRYQVILVMIEDAKRGVERKRPSAFDFIGYGARFHEPRTTEEWMRELREGEQDDAPVQNRLKIGSMKDELHLPENFDQVFEELDSQVASMFTGVAS